MLEVSDVCIVVVYVRFVKKMLNVNVKCVASCMPGAVFCIICNVHCRGNW